MKKESDSQGKIPNQTNPGDYTGIHNETLSGSFDYKTSTTQTGMPLEFKNRNHPRGLKSKVKRVNFCYYVVWFFVFFGVWSLLLLAYLEPAWSSLFALLLATISLITGAFVDAADRRK